MTEARSKFNASRLTLIGGLIAIFVAVWLLLDSNGVALPSLGKYWPIFMILGGIASLVDFLMLSKRPRSAGQTVALWGFAALALVFTLGHAGWRDSLDWLPAVPLIAGAAMLTTWAAGGTESSGLLAAGSVLITLGLTGLAARFDWLKDLLPSAQVVWAVLLAIVGGFLVYRAFKRPD